MVVVGFDVEQLYPSLEAEKTAQVVEEAVKMSKMKWSDLDYMVGARVLALNRSEDWCNRSPLRRVLPWTWRS